MVTILIERNHGDFVEITLWVKVKRGQLLLYVLHDLAIRGNHSFYYRVLFGMSGVCISLSFVPKSTKTFCKVTECKVS